MRPRVNEIVSLSCGVMLSCLSPSIANGGDKVVDQNDDDCCSLPACGTPAAPFCTIQYGLTYAGDNDTVTVLDGSTVEAGTYTGTGNTNLDFGGDSIWLKCANNGEGCTIDCEETSNCRAFNFHHEEDAGAIVDGFTITGGKVDGAPIGESGGGIRMQDSCPTIQNCVLTNNIASSSGGAVYVLGRGPEDCPPEIRDCVIGPGNDASVGGGIALAKGSDTEMEVSISDCVITGNTANDGAGIWTDYDKTDLTVRRTEITDNVAAIKGGGMYINTYIDSDIKIVNCKIQRNEANTFDGGGLYLDGNDASVKIANAFLEGNESVQHGGAIFATGDVDVQLRNSTLRGNKAYSLGQGDDGKGGGIYATNEGDVFNVFNSIVWGNTSKDVTDSEIYGYGSQSVNVKYSDVQHKTWGGEGDGNISLDPMFFAGYALYWAPISPCVDAGSNDLIPKDWADVNDDGYTSSQVLPWDIAEEYRQDDGDGTVDMGAFEVPYCLNYRKDDHTPCDSGAGAGECCNWDCVKLADLEEEESAPAHDETLWRSAYNIIRLKFDATMEHGLTDPEHGDPGDIEIRKMLDDGLFGPDLSGDFTYTYEPPDVMKIVEYPADPEERDDGVFVSRTWYAVRNVGNWCGVEDFEIHYLVQIGDCTNDGVVISLDVACVNGEIPCFVNCGDDAREDMDGDGRIISLDVGVVNAHLPSWPVPKPCGHEGADPCDP